VPFASPTTVVGENTVNATDLTASALPPRSTARYSIT
jgi:hypothetical protein